MYFTFHIDYKTFFRFLTPMCSSLILDRTKTVANWVLTRVSIKKFKLLASNLDAFMFNLANGRVVLKLNHSILAQKSFCSMYSNFILNLHIFYELNNWPCYPTNNYPLKNCLFDTVKLGKKRNKK